MKVLVLKNSEYLSSTRKKEDPYGEGIVELIKDEFNADVK